MWPFIPHSKTFSSQGCIYWMRLRIHFFILVNFFFGWKFRESIENKSMEPVTDLNCEKIQNYLKSYRDELNSLGVETLYLFGSVARLRCQFDEWYRLHGNVPSGDEDLRSLYGFTLSPRRFVSSKNWFSYYWISITLTQKIYRKRVTNPWSLILNISGILIMKYDS